MQSSQIKDVTQTKQSEGGELRTILTFYFPSGAALWKNSEATTGAEDKSLFHHVKEINNLPAAALRLSLPVL